MAAKKTTPKTKRVAQKESIAPRERAVKRAFAAGLSAGRELEAEEEQLDDGELDELDEEGDDGE